MIFRAPGVLAPAAAVCFALALSSNPTAANTVSAGAASATVASANSIATRDAPIAAPANNAASHSAGQSTDNRIADAPLNGGTAELDEVMRLLALRRHGRVEFVEQQFLAVLKRPLESFGEMSYDAPDRLEKHTLKPRAESLLLEGEKLTVEKGHSRRVVDLHAYPQILPFIESIRATLAGDRAALERVFSLDFAGNIDHWTLNLVPLDRQMAKNVAQVQIVGSGDQLRRIEIRQTDGDRSLMTLRPTTAP